MNRPYDSTGSDRQQAGLVVLPHVSSLVMLPTVTDAASRSPASDTSGKSSRPAALSRLTSSIHRAFDSPKPQRTRPVRYEWNGIKYETKQHEEVHEIRLDVPLDTLDPELLVEARTLFRRWDDDHAGILSAEDAPRFLQAVATRYEFPPELLEANLYWLHETLAAKGQSASPLLVEARRPSSGELDTSRSRPGSDDGRISPSQPVQLQALATEDDDDASAVPATPANDRSLAATAADLFDETDAVRLVAPALAELRIIKHDYAVLQELAQLESAERTSLSTENRRRMTELARWRETYQRRLAEREAEFARVCVQAAEERRVRARLAALAAAPLLDEPMITPIDVTVGCIEPQIEEGLIDDLLAKYDRRLIEREERERSRAQTPSDSPAGTPRGAAAAAVGGGSSSSPLAVAAAAASPRTPSSPLSAPSSIYSSMPRRRTLPEALHAQFASSPSNAGDSPLSLTVRRPASRSSTGSAVLHSGAA